MTITFPLLPFLSISIFFCFTCKIEMMIIPPKYLSSTSASLAQEATILAQQSQPAV
ncbi:hypothetical protein [Paraliobacillus zengyii]|uniref:hypothetical protein n=1 Tax=Paraliobacillus zengyii TaxID=2213194 RepID=UPI0013A6A160|nr:hypothetical protein [Paraliobacillus zengyii]